MSGHVDRVAPICPRHEGNTQCRSRLWHWWFWAGTPYQQPVDRELLVIDGGKPFAWVPPRWEPRR